MLQGTLATQMANGPTGPAAPTLPSSEILGATGGSGGSDAPAATAQPIIAPRRRSGAGGTGKGSTHNLLYGRADVKVYPLNEDQLSHLGLLKGLSGLCFTLAGAAGGFAINA